MRIQVRTGIESKIGADRERGNAVLLTLVILTLLLGLSIAQHTIVQKNLQQSNYYLSRAELRRYAESGVVIALHDLRRDVTGDDGDIGTADWEWDDDDLGRDGLSGTGDEGEGDGIPTPGEPNVVPVAVGRPELNGGLFTFVLPTGVAGVDAIVATSFSGDDAVTLVRQVQVQTTSIPKVGAVYLKPTVTVTGNGNVFSIDGRDYDADDGSLVGGGSDEWGLATDPAATPGDNVVAIVSQIPSAFQDQILGKVGTPSVGEIASPLDVDSVYTAFQSSATNVVAPGDYSDVSWGDWASNDHPVTYIDGDVELSGLGTGAGVLVVNGDLTVTGQFEFTGLVIVKGNATFTGGGAGIHVWGSVLLVDDTSALTVSGQTDLFYSSEALDTLEQTTTTPVGYDTVFYGGYVPGSFPPGGSDD